MRPPPDHSWVEFSEPWGDRFGKAVARGWAYVIAVVITVWQVAFAMSFPMAYAIITASGLAIAVPTLILVGRSRRSRLHRELADRADADDLWYRYQLVGR